MNRATLLFLPACFTASPAFARDAGPTKDRPNVLVILTDDQGYGDLGCHGNPKIKTPHLDKFASQGVHVPYFYVSPVCAPTRASLMTGRYNYRTGVTDTFLGRALMRPDEVTLPEMLAAAGYRTGIFGKWHLGDNYPLRPMDRGFQECLVLKGGGLAQPSDPPGSTGYFDPILTHNGKPERVKGYCTDVFTDAALRFLARPSEKPFFVYLAFNCPHVPLQVPDKYLAPYRKMNLAHGEFPAVGHPLPGKAQEDVIARVYAMITNVDDNVGRLFAELDRLKLAENTLVFFLTDNGPQQVRYNSGLLGRKGGVHEGGIRVPFYARWPGKFKAGGKVDRIAAHVDLAPTVLDACGVARPARVQFDGRSLLPLLRGDKVDWPDRTLYFQWHRGDEPQLYRAFAARSQRYKLVQPLGAGASPLPKDPPFLLYDMADDPLEQKDVAARHPEVVARMRKGYEAWFKDVGAKGFAPPRIHLGAPQEDPSLLTRQDWRGPAAGWGPEGLGHWEVQVAREGTYDVTLRFAAVTDGARLHFGLRGVSRDESVKAGATMHVFKGLKLTAGPGRLEAWVEHGKDKVGVHYVEVKRGP
jgi:arylsulfatase A-like enzyme